MDSLTSLTRIISITTGPIPIPCRKCPRTGEMLKMLKVFRNFFFFFKVLKTGEMLKMLKVFWEIDPLSPLKKMLKTGEMLKMLKVFKRCFKKKCLKLGKC